ncbi:MAG: hypothetical protein ABL999_14775 [Pyrinomonadaceae bacterium]
MNLIDLYTKGDRIIVKAFPDRTLERRVAGMLDGKTVFVCNDEEFNAALEEGREPTSIGFPITDVIINDYEQ